MLLWQLGVLKIILDKELAVNCLIEIHTKLRELILAAIALCGLIRVLGLCDLQEICLMAYFISWYYLGHSSQRRYVQCAGGCVDYKARGVVHDKSPVFFLPSCCWYHYAGWYWRSGSLGRISINFTCQVYYVVLKTDMCVFEWPVLIHIHI